MREEALVVGPLREMLRDGKSPGHPFNSRVALLFFLAGGAGAELMSFGHVTLDAWDGRGLKCE